MEGWRQWQLTETKDGWRLKGAYNKVWNSSLAKADIPPDETNNSGIYAWNSINLALGYLINYSPIYIVGGVELGGKEVVHSDGRIRGEYAKIQYFLTKPNTTQDYLDKLQFYQVPILTIDIDQLIKDYLKGWKESQSLILSAPKQLKPEDYQVPTPLIPPPVTLPATDLDIAKFERWLAARQKYSSKDKMNRLAKKKAQFKLLYGGR